MKKTPLITITTDFGDSFASAQLQAVIASLGFEGKAIENHSITPFSIIEGAFEIQVLSKYCPRGTIHVGVVDPGVGGERRGIVIKTNEFWYVGPDNGLFYPAVSETIQGAWELQENLVSEEITATFHGRDVFIKVAVYIAQGRLLEEFGCLPIRQSSLKKISFEKGQVLHIDYYGNIKIHWQDTIKPGEKLIIEDSYKKFEVPIVKTFTDVSQGEPLALLGSSNTLELAVNLGNASKFFNVNNGDMLRIIYKEQVL